MKISCSMIVKNEEEMLPACLESVKWVDELIIVDTGSEDKTIEIAQSFGAQVFTDYKWADNFSEARNVSLAKCTGDWVLIIDADEILEHDEQTVRELLEHKFMAYKDAVMFRVDTGRETNDQIRIFRNRADIEWSGAAHNLPHIRTEKGYKRIEDIHWSTLKVKSNFSPNHIVDPDRTLRIMTKELSKGPQALGQYQYTRYLYYVAREWLNRRDPIRALFYLRDYVKLAPPTNELADAWFLIATCCIDLNRLEEAIDACLQTAKYLPSYKAAWAIIHNLSAPENKKMWEKLFHMADNKGVLFVRKEAEKLFKEKK